MMDLIKLIAIPNLQVNYFERNIENVCHYIQKILNVSKIVQTEKNKRV